MPLPKTVDPETADTDEMIDILHKRFDRMLFVGIRSLDNERYTSKIRYKDLPQDALGLSQYAHTYFTRQIRETEEPQNELPDDDSDDD